ncbi:hypothetical protein KI387_026382, partial [Taxus chinensis]
MDCSATITILIPMLLLLLLFCGRTRLVTGFVDETPESAYCITWRFNVEANNVRHWKVVPEECIHYIQSYMLDGHYERDMAAVVEQAVLYAKEITPARDDHGIDAWVLDVDDTALSNLEYYKTRKFGGEVFNQDAFSRWVLTGKSPALTATLELYEQLINLGFTVYFITGRDESQREITRDNLLSQGYTKWGALILRGESDRGDSAVVFKSRKREELIKKGVRIWGNGGDQWSDVTGDFVGVR